LAGIYGFWRPSCRDRKMKSHSNDPMKDNSLFQKYIEQADAAESRYIQGDGVQALDKAIQLWGQILIHPEFVNIDEPFRLMIFNNSASTYLRRYWERSDIADLNIAIFFYEQAVSKTPEDSPSLPDFLTNFGNGLRERYFYLGNFKDLDEGIKAYRKAVFWASENSLNLPMYLSNLGIGLRNRYSLIGNFTDIEEGVKVSRKAVSLTPENSQDLSRYLSNLGNILRDRYFCLGNLTDLEESIKSYQKAVSLTPKNSPDLPMYLNNLGIGFVDIHSCLGNLTNLEEGIKIFRKAVSLTPKKSTELSSRLVSLGGGLRNRYSCLGNLADLEECINIYRKAISLSPESSPNLPIYLGHLGSGLADRYYHMGNYEDLEECIKVYKKAVYLTPESSSYMPYCLNNLGSAFGYRYSSTGNLTDLEESIIVYQKAVSLSPENSPDLSMFLCGLGNSFIGRYSRLGSLADLEKGINFHRKATSMTSETSPNLSGYLNNLGVGLREHYQRLGNLTDIKEGIKFYDKAISLSENSPDLPMYLSNFGTALMDIYSLTNDTVYIENGIKAYQKAISLLSENSPDLPCYLNNLGTALTDRYDSYSSTENLTHLEEGIKVCQKAVSLTPENSPYLSCHLNNPGKGLLSRYCFSSDFADFEEGIKNFQKAAEIGLNISLEESLRSSKNWLQFAFNHQLWKETEQSYFYAYHASQRLLRSQLLRDEKENWLKETQGFAAQAAYALAKLDKLQDASVAIENGLARLLSEILAIDRANLEQLKKTEHAHLIDDYQQATGQWYVLTQKNNLSEQDLATLQSAREKLDKTIERIRTIEGYKNFLASPEFEDIQTAAKENPLIYILTTEIGGLALIVRKTVIPVWLPELTSEILSEQLEAYLNAYSERGTESQVWMTVLETMTLWLWDVVMKLIVEAMPPDTKKITLIPSGLLTLLPLQAAWEKETGRYISDIFTISYSPNARSLNEAHVLAAQVKADKMLAVDNPSGDLYYSRYEVQKNRSLSAYKVLSHRQAIRNAVLNSLPFYNILHFSCHGKTNINDPLSSGLLMKDGEILLKDFLKLRLKVRITVLSACETGIPGTKLPDEIVHLPSALLQAGVAGVVASLWTVNELSTMMLMIRFYEFWQEKQIEPTEALRQSQIWVRDSTNKEKIEYFKFLKNIRTEHTEIFHEILKQIYQAIGFSDPESRDFAHPYFWAGFVFSGV